jgi:hypothetical protein
LLLARYLRLLKRANTGGLLNGLFIAEIKFFRYRSSKTCLMAHGSKQNACLKKSIFI